MGVQIVANKFRGDLAEVAVKLGHKSVPRMVLALSVFAPPSIVRETGARPIVNAVRRGCYTTIGRFERRMYVSPADVKRQWGIECVDPSAKGAWVDDNNCAHEAFGACFTVAYDKPTTHLSHIFRGYTQHPQFFTSLANLVLVPAWLAKLTDADSAVCATLQWVARAGFGFCPGCSGNGVNCMDCRKPDGLELDEAGAKEIVGRFEARRVDDYTNRVRAIRRGQWRSAIEAGRGYAAPFLQPIPPAAP